MVETRESQGMTKGLREASTASKQGNELEVLWVTLELASFSSWIYKQMVILPIIVSGHKIL